MEGSNGPSDKKTDLDSSWLEGPNALGLVTSRVEDAELVSARRSQFVQSAIKVFCRKGYHSATVKEIAQEAGVSPGLIYQYVNDKEEVLFLSIQLIVYTLKNGLPQAFHSTSNPLRRFYACFEAYCRVVDLHRDSSLLTYRETSSLSKPHRDFIKDMELETNEIIAIAVRECIQAEYFEKVNVELFVYHTIITAQAWALKYWRLAKITDLDEYIAVNARFLMSSVLTEKGREEFEKVLAG